MHPWCSPKAKKWPAANALASRYVQRRGLLLAFLNNLFQIFQTHRIDFVEAVERCGIVLPGGRLISPVCNALEACFPDHFAFAAAVLGYRDRREIIGRPDLAADIRVPERHIPRFI